MLTDLVGESILAAMSAKDVMNEILEMIYERAIYKHTKEYIPLLITRLQNNNINNMYKNINDNVNFNSERSRFKNKVLENTEIKKLKLFSILFLIN